MSYYEKDFNSIYYKEYKMYKKNKVNLSSIKRIMDSKEKTRREGRMDYIENLMKMTTDKLGKQQKQIDQDNKTKKKLWREKQKKVFY